MRFRVQFDEAGRDIAIKLSREDMAIAADMGEHMEIVQPTVADHRQLEHRDAPDQHPIEAVTGLSDELDGKQPTLTFTTNADIDAMFRAVQRRREKLYG